MTKRQLRCQKQNYDDKNHSSDDDNTTKMTKHNKDEKIKTEIKANNNVTKTQLRRQNPAKMTKNTTKMSETVIR